MKKQGFQSAHTNQSELPIDVSPFVGRQVDLDQLRTLLIGSEATRLITILGQGGMGKTRLAQELAASLRDNFPQGVYFISFAGLAAKADLDIVVAAALGIHSSLGDDLHQTLLDELRSKQILLVMDNFEQLLEKSLLISDILAAARQVKILVTSREKLNLQEETLYHLGGLQFSVGSDEIEKYDAVKLFLQRARQARPGYSIHEQDILPIMRICQLVDGMPLGILLAAAWMEHFSALEIAVQIEQNLDFLSQEFRDLPARHRSLRAVFDSSFEQLDETQRSVFLRLAVFCGDFSLDAAAAIAGADLKTLLSLMKKSLLHRDNTTGRYTLHELLRQYSGEKLAQTGEIEQLNQAYADYFLRLIHQFKEQLKSASQFVALDAIQADFGNITQAWKWAAEHRDFHNIGLSAATLYAFCDMRSRYFEGEILFGLARQALAPQPGETPHTVWALILLSWYDFLPFVERGKFFTELTSQANSCLKQAKSGNNVESMAACLVLLGALSGDCGDQNAAIGFYRDAMQLYPQLDNFYWVNMRVGLSYQSLGQYEPAISAFKDSLARGQALGERVKMGWSLLNIGNTLSMAGERAEAEKYIREAMLLFEEIGTSIGVMWADYGLSELAFANGDVKTTKEWALRALELARQIHSPTWAEKIGSLLQKIEARQPRTKNIAEPLSERELEVMKLLQSEMDGPEIAKRLCVSLNTVRFHTKNIYRKLQVQNRWEAIQRARELKI